MLAAKTGGADAIFVPNPFDDQQGLMKADGSPGALLLPWRSTALALSGAEYLGSIVLPEGSHNAVFVRDDTAVMVVWHERPTRERLYLGEKSRKWISGAMLPPTDRRRPARDRSRTVAIVRAGAE